MTDLSLIKKDFIILSSYSEEEAKQFEPFMEAEAEYVSSLLKNKEDENKACVVFLCAARAYYQCFLTNQSDGISSFKAGDISYSLDTSEALNNARAICDFALAKCSAFLKDENFAFEVI